MTTTLVGGDGGLPPKDYLEALRRWVYERARSGGCTCPACDRFVKIYERPVHATMAKALIKMYRTSGRDWFNMNKVIGRQSDESKLRYWGLIEQAGEARPDGAHPSLWRVTELGELFVKGLVSVPRVAVIYDAGLLRLDDTEHTTIFRALNERFDYDALMGRDGFGNEN